MDTDFRETFTMAARQALVVVESKGLDFSFDCEASPVSLEVTTHQLRASLGRLLNAASDLLSSGTLHMSALTYQKPCGQVEALIQYGGLGKTTPAAQLLHTLKQLRFTELPQDDCEGKFVKAGGTCPATSAQVTFKGIVGREFLLSTCLASHSDARTALTRMPDANHARVWLVASNVIKAKAWYRRFHRLGWVVHIFPTFEDIVLHLDHSTGFSLPKVIIGMASNIDQSPAMEEVCIRLSHACKLIYAVEAGSAILRSPQDISGYEVLVYPLSPATLEALTEAAAEEGEFSAMTAPLPLDLVEEKLALIVDDDEVNALIGRSMLESMGYVVKTVRDGIDAVNACRPCPPDLVLMDVEMPQMDGFQTARTLRGLQLEGLLPPFPILGMTAEWSGERRCTAISAGMDDCIAKPIDQQLLNWEVKRLCTLR